MDGKAYGRNEIIGNSIKTWCKYYFQEFNLEHLQRSFRCVINVTHCIIWKRYFKGDCGLKQRSIQSNCQGVMLKEDSNILFPDHCLPSSSSNPITQTGLDYYQSLLSLNGKEKDRLNVVRLNKKDPMTWLMLGDQVKWNALENSFIYNYHYVE